MPSLTRGRIRGREIKEGEEEEASVRCTEFTKLSFIISTKMRRKHAFRK